MKKGFTLIELLAVIVLLAILVLLAVTTVVKQTSKGNNEIYESQLKTIKLAAEMWGSENKNTLKNYNECVTITLGYLKKEGYIDQDIKNTKTGKKFEDNELFINITPSVNTYKYEIYSNKTKKCKIVDFVNVEEES